MTHDEAGIVTKLSPLPVAGTVAKLTGMISAKGIKLKVLVWDDDGQTKVSYYSPGALAARYHLSADLAGNLAAINVLTDALVASS